MERSHSDLQEWEESLESFQWSGSRNLCQSLYLTWHSLFVSLTEWYLQLQLGDWWFMSHLSQFCRGPRDNPLLHKHARNILGPPEYSFFIKERNKSSSPQETKWSWGQSTLTNTSTGVFKNILLHNLCRQSPSHALTFKDFPCGKNADFPPVAPRNVDNLTLPTTPHHTPLHTHVWVLEEKQIKQSWVLDTFLYFFIIALSHSLFYFSSTMSVASSHLRKISYSHWCNL